MPSRAIHSRSVLAILALSAALGSSGCLHNKVQAAPPVQVAPLPEAERPMNVAPDTDALPPQPADAAPPVVPSDESAPPLSAIAKPKMPPAPPKPSTGQPSPEPATEAAAHPPAPQISPSLSPAAQQNYERQTNDDVSVAERNLQQASGRQLNARQQDMLENVRNFLTQSRDASKGGDWARAQNLAQKARVLSVELVNSL
jgi:hypothetical protein